MSRYNIIKYSATTRTILAFGQSLRSPSICNQSVPIKRSLAVGTHSENAKHTARARAICRALSARVQRTAGSIFFEIFQTSQ